MIESFDLIRYVFIIHKYKLYCKEKHFFKTFDNNYTPASNYILLNHLQEER